MNAELSRRVGRIMGRGAMDALIDSGELPDFVEAVANAPSFDALPASYRAIILQAEREPSGPVVEVLPLPPRP